MRIFRELYLPSRFFIFCIIGVFALVMAFIFPVLYWGVWGIIGIVGIGVVMDILLLFTTKEAILGSRKLAEKFSNGEENEVKIVLQNRYPWRVYLRILDEIPIPFQIRTLTKRCKVESRGEKVICYPLRPVKRGEYEFGKIQVFAATFWGFAERRFSLGEETKIVVYPAFAEMRKYELMAIGARQHPGDKQVRPVGASTSFDQIKPYVVGDDPRRVNWKATAKCNRLMVNSYTDEKAQSVYCLLDKGRTMQFPFREMTMLDYAINAVLALTDVILKKGDRAGLYTFSNNSDIFIKSDNRGGQLRRINEALYNQQTYFLESDFEQMYIAVNRFVQTRSLLVLFTNFESMAGLERRLPLLRKLTRQHLLLVVLFENAEIREVAEETAESVYDIYFHALALEFTVEKERIVRVLRQQGIPALLCRPEDLSVGVINAYLKLKEKNVI